MSVGGVTVGAMALIIVLSVFNGFETLVISLFNSFNPDLEIKVKKGKTFSMSTFPAEEVIKLAGVKALTEVVEENALLKYRNNQFLATVKGVSDNIVNTSGLDTMLIEGRFTLHEMDQPRIILGAGVAYYLNASLNDLLYPITVYLPRREANIGASIEKAFNSENIFPSAVFSIQQDFDTKYTIVPIEFARELLDYEDEVTSIELSLNKSANVEKVKKEIVQLIGNDYEVRNRFEQQVLLYRIMKSEKWSIFLILSFILVIAAFNVISSLTMLILDKKDDVRTLHNLGATDQLIKRIFMLEGMMISIGGAVLGLILGGFISWLQQEFGLISLGDGSGSFVVDAYPVKLLAKDFLIVFLVVLAIGFLVAWYPVKQISKKYLSPKSDYTKQ
ncbi:MAG TPA: ABC transporter permease [Bacteroidales bacterium]|nr:ABC transporter permease [Bacteroidales bacterium]HOG66858.1 ABC transporter permease [Bacteroidales bacterium]HPA12424.1 ABC transporter permease [Bacteroidales bacterium]HQO07844.1 ABC transporter permease [Bacteroidales bacterium]HQP52436.1 ABC transporter permease [Bacteroidales bacterium]